MPISINTGSMKYKDPATGNFVPLNAIGDDLQNIIAPSYSDLTFPISAGALCLHNGVLYKANTDIPSSEAWTAAHWTETTVEDELNVINGKADKANPVFTGSISLGRSENTTVGNGSFAVGLGVEASGSYSHAEGLATTASGNYSHAEGNTSVASGSYSHAEGIMTTASGSYSHAEGNGSVASGSQSHAEGMGTASGSYSHAEGIGTASGVMSHAGGSNTIANSLSQYVFGENNIADPGFASAGSRGTYVEIVGNGTDNNARSNARTLDWDGNEELAGDLTINKGSVDEVSVSELAEDVGDLKNAINVLDNSKAPVIIDSASGAIATFPDGADGLPLESLVVDIDPVQDLHGQSSPYPAGGGKNKAPVNSFTATHDTVMTFSPNLPSGEYTYSYKATRTGSDQRNGAIRFVYDDDTYLQEYFYVDGTRKNKTATFEKPLASIYVYSISGSYADSGNFELTATDFQIESGSTATAYAPYSNICPITGWTGCNVTRCGRNLLNNITPDIVNGYLKTDKTISANAYNRTVIVPCKPNTTYTYTWNRDSITSTDDSGIIGFSEHPVPGETVGTSWLVTSSQYNDGVPKTFTTGSNDKYLAIKIANINNSDFTETLKNSILVLGASAGNYEPYTGQTYPVTWQTAGTVYGGTLNPVTGELVVDTIKYRVPLLTESQITVASNNYIKADACDGFLYLNPPMNPSVGPQPLPYTPYCNMFRFGKNSIWSMTGYANCFTLNNGQLHLNIANDLIGVTDYTQETLATARTKIVNYLNSLYNSGNYVEVCYKITPTTYTLTPTEIRTLLGYNAIFADTGDVAVDYRADTKLFVEKTEVSGVQDVKVNGSSVVTDGVANVPKIARDGSSLGVAKIAYSMGTMADANGTIGIFCANDSLIKSGQQSYRAIVPGNQHEATFYGLAKVAGADEKNSSLSVGTYTESAKSAIASMLDAPETISGTTPSITAKAGVRYICGECSTLTIVAPASGCIDVTFTSGSTPTVLTVTPPTGMTMRWANGFDPSSLDANTVYEVNILDGEYGVVGSWT